MLNKEFVSLKGVVRTKGVLCSRIPKEESSLDSQVPNNILCSKGGLLEGSPTLINLRNDHVFISKNTSLLCRFVIPNEQNFVN